MCLFAEGNIECLELLLNGPKNNRADVNGLNKTGRTALHLAVERNEVDLVDCLLRVPGVELDLKDKKGGQTPLYLAVRNRSPQLVEMLLEQGANIDEVCAGKSIRSHIQEKMPEFNPSLVKTTRAPLERETSVSTTEQLFGLVDRAGLRRRPDPGNLEQFRSLLLQLDTKALTSLKSGGLTLLQKCCSAGLDLHVDALLGEGVDPNYCPAESLAAPVLLAAGRGRFKVLQVLRSHHADFSVTKKQTEETVLHRLLLKDENLEQGEFQSCLELLLSNGDEDLKQQIDKIINRKDILGNTALHYGTQRWDQATVRALLERGANIGIRNKWGEIPIQKIEPETMEAFLNEFCLESVNDVNHEEFELTFRYSFLAPPLENLPPEVQGPYSEDEENQKISDLHGPRRCALPETESLWYMGQTKQHRHLLKHPVVTSFLWCKWNRIRRYFNRNLRFYALFVTVLTWYVFETFGGEALRAEPEGEGEGQIRFWYGFFIFFSVSMTVFIIKDWISDVKDLGQFILN